MEIVSKLVKFFGHVKNLADSANVIYDENCHKCDHKTTAKLPTNDNWRRVEAVAIQTPKRENTARGSRNVYQ